MSMVKILAFFELGPRLNIKYGFNRAGKNELFSRPPFIPLYIGRGLGCDLRLLLCDG